MYSAATSLQIFDSTFRGNLVSTAAEQAKPFGGGIFLATKTTAQFSHVEVLQNRALITGDGKQPNGGGLFVSAGASAKLSACGFQGNFAGGRGFYEAERGNWVQTVMEIREVRGAHIFSQGHTVLKECTIAEKGGEDVFYKSELGLPAWWWIVADEGTLKLDASTFSARPQGYLFDPCPYIDDRTCGHCNKDGSPLGDYADCDRDTTKPRPRCKAGSEQAQSSYAACVSPAKLLNIKKAEVLIVGCELLHVVVASATASCIADQEIGIRTCAATAAEHCDSDCTVCEGQCRFTAAKCTSNGMLYSGNGACPSESVPTLAAVNSSFTPRLDEYEGLALPGVVTVVPQQATELTENRCANMVAGEAVRNLF